MDSPALGFKFKGSGFRHLRFSFLGHREELGLIVTRRGLEFWDYWLKRFGEFSALYGFWQCMLWGPRNNHDQTVMP